jgi:hypothetical protein
MTNEKMNPFWRQHQQGQNQFNYEAKLFLFLAVFPGKWFTN